jgi:tetratricopeptide (TPR) repeat protein
MAPMPPLPSDPRGAAGLQADFERAASFHRQGRYAEAERIYRAILGSYPAHFPSAALLAAMLLEHGDFTAAVDQFRHAIRLRSDVPLAHFQLGCALNKLERFDEALVGFGHAISLNPAFAEAFHGLGQAYRGLKRHGDALVSFDRAVTLRPDYAEAFNDLGLALHELERFADALESYDRAVALEPDHPVGHYNRGKALQDLRRFDEAIAGYDKAIALEPGHAAAFHNRGLALHRLKKFDEALDSYERATAMREDFAECFTSRGLLLHELGRFDEALASYDQAIASRPDYTDALYARAGTHLALGRFARGWEDAEYRWLSPTFRTLSSVAADPDSLALWFKKEAAFGKRVLVVAEQGAGDEIMFASMVPDLARDAAKVALECDPRLMSLFARSFTQCDIYPRGSLRHLREGTFDYLLPAASLGRLYRNSLSDFPDRESYLRPDAVIVESWRHRLATLGPGLKVGISWKGGTDKTRREARSVTLEHWRPILEFEEAHFISLQHGDVRDEIALANQGLIQPITQFDPAELPDFDQLAGLVAALDLVVSVQTTLVHLSGAIGQRCWVMVPQAPEWRYGVEGSEIPWYSSVKLYRQKSRGDWSETIAKMVADLAAFAKAGGPGLQQICHDTVAQT